ncbi:hypothetical protein TNCV_2207511 [Trichonephila clavipes]|uniref:Uncharacterized protein n=1 Tax=Trichonephila clavipes TaxID=2585209 RepID=A0A8X6S627_TRICX|nr:hypothetical protein TNCV_2207511 [Trichonephila clavipes]
MGIPAGNETVLETRDHQTHSSTNTVGGFWESTYESNTKTLCRVKLVEGKLRWEAFDHHQSVPPVNWRETEPNRIVTSMLPKATANDKRHLAHCPDEFRGPRSGFLI